MILDYQEQKNLLEKYKITEIESELVTDKSNIDEAIKKLGFPLVLKIASKKHLHRTEVGGVFLDVKTAEEAVTVFEKLTQINDVDGVIFQKKIKGFEFILGAKHDNSFGPIVMIGSGGVMVELFNDTSFYVAPLTEEDAYKMIEDIRGKKLLEGFRGSAPIKKELLVDLLVKTSHLINNEKIKELEFNPVIVNEEGAFVCDVKITI